MIDLELYGSHPWAKNRHYENDRVITPGVSNGTGSKNIFK
jgi:hypothetical protein